MSNRLYVPPGWDASQPIPDKKLELFAKGRASNMSGTAAMQMANPGMKRTSCKASAWAMSRQKVVSERIEWIRSDIAAEANEPTTVDAAYIESALTLVTTILSGISALAVDLSISPTDAAKLRRSTSTHWSRITRLKAMVPEAPTPADGEDVEPFPMLAPVPACSCPVAS